MKKALAIILALVVVVCAGFTIAAFAAPGGFVSSPSGSDGPVLVDVEHSDDSCEPEIVVTPYKDREELDEEKENDMNKAYEEIAANEDLTKMCPELKAVADAKGIPAENLAVSDLFDVSAYHTRNDHEYCGTTTISLKAETIKKFVALLHRDPDTQKWEVVDGVVVDRVNNTITFSAQDFSPYAIVIDKTADTMPDTGSNLYIPAIMMVVSAVSLAGVLISLKKKQRA